MPAHPRIHIASANMRKRNLATHILLNDDTNTHLFLIQEPWFNKIGTARKDDTHDGIDVRGGVACPAFEILYPGLTEGQQPKVMAYARKPAQNGRNTTPFTVVPRIDICAHPSIQILDLVFDNQQWRVINFYHDIRDNTCIQAFLALDIDATTPALVIGDFNAHSPSWSPPNVSQCRFADRIEQWAARNLLTLANNPGEITRKGAAHEKDSVIDLTWYNDAAIQANTFSEMRLDWDGSLDSDHAMTHVMGETCEAPTKQTPGLDLGLIIDSEKREEWTSAFKARSIAFPFQLTPTAAEVEAAAASFMADVQRTNEETFRKRKPPHPKAAPWWNDACATAVQNFRNAQGTEAKGIAQARLKGTVRAAKRRWADDYIEQAQLWDVAGWRHGRRLSKVPSLKGPEGLVHSHEGVADILSQRFFAQTPPRVELNFADDPPPRPTRTLPPIDEDMVDTLLKKAASKSAPGQSGHTWTILKWAWAADARRLLDLLTACLKAGHHPRQWKEAVVCVIPKPKRADYTLAKNFRPISLLECLGKLLEKVVAKIIYREMDKHALVPTTQFGGRNASSTLDAGLTLLHDIQAAHQSGLRTGLLLFDIQGFFDNINHERLIHTFANLGFAPELTDWCRSFLKDRTVRLRFNGKTSDPFDFMVGTPQGSPVSPVLSIIYTSPILYKMKEWAKASLGMYVDDGAIFASGRDWLDIESTMRVGYSACIDWLSRAGLNAEPDKTELIFFKRRLEKTTPPRHIHLPLPSLNTYYRVQTSSTLRYLGFFFDTKLSWTHHVEVMCNRTRATLKALQLLGNSVRGLDHASWKLAYNAICLPVLTYGCQLWFKGKQVTLVKKLQTVQNDAVRIMTGTFRTTPREPLHQLLNILPMDLRLNTILKSTALRLYKVPKGSQLLKRLGSTWHSASPDDLPLPASNRRSIKTTLRSLAARVPASGPRINSFPDIPPEAPTWNGRVQVVPKQHEWDYDRVTNTLVEACREGETINIFCDGVISNKGRADGKQVGATSAVLYRGGKDHSHAERILGETVTEPDAILRSIHSGLDMLTELLDSEPAQQHKLITISLASGAAVDRALDAAPHEDQEESISLLKRLSNILERFPHANIALMWLPRKAPFVGFKRAKQLALEAIRTASLDGIQEPQSLGSQRKKAREDAIAAWAERYYKSPLTSMVFRTTLTSPPDGKTHHTFQHKQPKNTKAKFARLTFATFYRIITGHVFVGEYTQRFYPQHTADQIACPCGETLQTIEHVIMYCPLYADARHELIAANGCPRNFPQLTENPKRVQELLRFIERTAACKRPQAAWEPG